MPVLFDGELMADYHQFYLQDASADAEIAIEWTDADLKSRMVMRDGLVVLTTERNMMVPVSVRLSDHEPQIDLQRFDHAVLGHIRTSGSLVIAGLTDYLPDARRLPVPAGDLCVLSLSQGLGTLSTDGLDGDDRYDIHLWPCAPVHAAAVDVLRQWPANE